MTQTQLPVLALERLHAANRLMASSQHTKAYPILIDLLSSYPKNGLLNYLTGQCYLHWQEFDQAIACFTLCCQVMPQHFDAIFALMESFESVNAHEDVATLNDYMLQQFPKQPEVLYKAAQYYSEIGKFADAVKVLNECIKECEKTTDHRLLQSYAYLLLCKVDKDLPKERLITKLNKMVNADITNEHARMLCHYSLGEIYHSLENPNEAFTHWQAANQYQLSTASFRTQDLSGFFNDIKRCHAHLKPSAGDDAQSDDTFVPIFILGLPRTGSSLLDSLLSAHSQIQSMGEVTTLSNKLAAFLSNHYQQPYPAFMQDIITRLSAPNTQNVLAKCAQLYTNDVRKRQLTSQFVINKLPANFQSIGLIKTVFPNAKIIHLVRNFEDTALSVFRHHFSSSEPYFCDIAELSAYNAMYLDVMSFWQQIYGEQILTLRYEDLVSDTPRTIKSVLQYCGLAFEQACCYTTTAKNSKDDKPLVPIKTLSAVQVREPITTKPVGVSSQYRHLMAACLTRS